jgi:tRNA(Ile)-lysidine synthase
MKRDEILGSTWPPAWLSQVRRRVRRWCDAGLGRTWVVAVSGGSDSVGLLRALHALGPGLGLALSVAHLHHGVRGEAARADAAFVETLAGELGLPCDLGQWQPTRTGHFEADARRARYAWLCETAGTRGAAVVAVGHTLDDQAETILHRVVRGTGIRGLSGIPQRRVLSGDPPVNLVRPLLAVSRQSIRESLDALGQSYREDASNADLARTRARIRHDLLPRLAREYNPRIAEALVRLGNLAADSERAMDRRLREMAHSVTWSSNQQQVEIHRDGLLVLPVFLRAEVLRRVWREAGWPQAGMSARRWRRLAILARSQRVNRLAIGAGVELTTTGASGCPPHQFVLRRISTTASLEQEQEQALPQGMVLDVPGAVAWGDGLIRTVLDPEAPRDETIDLDRIVPPLAVRSAVPGDRFQPLGMGGKSTPLNDFFRGRRVARQARAQTLLLCDKLGIVWVVGHRISDRVKVTEATSRTLGLRWEAASPAEE